MCAMEFLQRINLGALNAVTYALYARKYEAPISCSDMLYLSPQEIQEIPVNKPSTKVPMISAVKGGDWDTKTRAVEDDVVYRGFVQRFERNLPWEETAYYDFMIDRLEEDSLEWQNYHTEADIEERCSELDRLYEEIKSTGYKSQKDIRETQKHVSFSNKNRKTSLLPPEMKEIAVDISRNGNFLWAAGMHRLCMAKLIGINEIPARVRIRHRKWQHKRDVHLGESDGSSPHPDIP